MTTSLGFLARRSPLSVGFRFKNSLIGAVPLVGGTSLSYCFFARSTAFLQITPFFFAFVHFCIKGGREERLRKNSKNKILKNKPKESNGLMLACNSIIAMADVCGLRSFTIPMNGSKGDKFFPGPLLEWDTKDFLQKNPLFKRHFWTVLSCNQNKHYVRKQ